MTVDALVARIRSEPDGAVLLAMLFAPTTPARPARVRPRIVPPHARHGRGTYVAGCRLCAERNAAYARRWRAGRRVAGGAVTSRVEFTVLAVPVGRGRRQAGVGQVAMVIERRTA